MSKSELDSKCQHEILGKSINKAVNLIKYLSILHMYIYKIDIKFLRKIYPPEKGVQDSIYLNLSLTTC